MNTKIFNALNSKILLYSILIFSLTNVNAQSKVSVEKPYEPVIKDAYKISKLPINDDTIKTNKIFNYNISTSPIQRMFKPKSINPAKLRGEPEEFINKGFVKAGLGNYLGTKIEARISNLKSENLFWNIYLDHNSNSGKIDNDGIKTFAGINKSIIGAYGQKMIKNANIYGNMNFNHNKYYYFGRTSKFDLTNIDEITKQDLNSKLLNIFKTNIGIYSTYNDSTHLNYDISTQFTHSLSQNNIKEDQFDVSTDINYYMNHQFTGTQVKMHYIDKNGLADTTSNVIVDFNPWIGAFGKKWRIQIGVNTTYDTRDTKYYFYPSVKIHYNIIKFIIVPYIEFSGKYQSNTYKDLLSENHFVKINKIIQPTNIKQILTGGLRGNISSRLGFNLNFTHKKIDNQYFFTDPDSTSRIQYFNITYDNLELNRFLAEISFKQSEKLFLILQTEYNKYSLDSLEHPYYNPVYKINASARYTIKKKITLSSDIFYLGDRYYKPVGEKDKKLNDIFNINIAGEYNYNSKLSGFIKINNLLAQKSYEWQNYRLLGMQVLIGATYKF